MVHTGLQIFTHQYKTNMLYYMNHEMLIPHASHVNFLFFPNFF